MREGVFKNPYVAPLMTAAEAIDTMDFSGIVGSLAGDNTIFLVVSENIDANELVNQFRDMLNA